MRKTSLVVFIHGFNSSSKKCWSRKDISWPEIFRNDLDFKNYEILEIDYLTGIFESNYSIDDCSNEINIRLRTAFKTFGIFNELIFICHSFGGIVARDLISKNKIDIKNKKLKLILVSSPSLGSRIANFFYKALEFIKNQQIKSLRYESSELNLLDKNFKETLSNSKNISGIELVEQNNAIIDAFLIRRFAPELVQESSSIRYFNHVKIPNTNHFNICKPSNHKSFIHECVKNFIRSHEDNQFNEIAPDPLFDIYDSSHEKFYLPRNIDRQCEISLKQKSIWIHGVSGSGKTSISKRLISKNNQKTIYIYSSQSIDEKISNRINKEISDILKNKFFIDANESSNDINIKKICEQINLVDDIKTIPIYFDELKINETNNDSSIVNYLIDFIEILRDICGPSTRIIISSIKKPDSKIIPSKFSEKFKFIECTEWNSTDIYNLNHLISKEFNDSKIKKIETKNIKTPRDLKEAYREAILEQRILGVQHD